MSPTTIEWTNETWNPTTGCDRVSPGCDHCYAATIAGRLWPTQYPPNPDGSPRRFEDVRLHPDRLELPLRWRRPRLVFVDSMSDLFHDDVPTEFIEQVFVVMARATQHTFQVLTKRPGRMASVLNNPGTRNFIINRAASENLGQRRSLMESHVPVWPLPNVWLGTSVENQKWANVRIPKLLETPAAVHFLSVEPLLGPVDLRNAMAGSLDALAGDRKDPADGVVFAGGRSIDWVIVGGESGREARPMHPKWAMALRDQCQDAGVPFFFKQWGEWGPFPEWGTDFSDDRGVILIDEIDGRIGDAGDRDYHLRSKAERGWTWPMKRMGKHAAGRELDGRTWDEMPARSA